jgi:manganese/zinc/iron transport system substrate-binding protein
MLLSRREALSGLVASTALIAGAGPLSAAASAGTIDVVATTGMIADGVRRIGGPFVTVKGLMGPGVDPHSYRQTRSDIVSMIRADQVFWHGLYLEAQMEQFFLDLARKRNVVALADALPKSELLSHPSYGGRFDPHVWMAPPIWSQVVAGVPAILSNLRPDAAEVLAARTEDYRREIADLDTYAREVLDRVDPEQRVLLTAHDAFSYFGRTYGFEVIGIQGISTESEAGLNRISELVDLLVARGIRAAFVESSVSDRNIRALVEGAAARGHEVSIGGELFSDAMGAEGTYEGTYLGMIDHNVTTIATALGADIDPRGHTRQLAIGS